MALLSGTEEGVDQATLDQINADYEEALKEAVPSQKIAAMTSTIAGEVQNSINSGKSVVLVPHSQGCLYANSVFQEATASAQPHTRLKIMGVAETASSIYGDTFNTSYVTAAEDWAIFVLRNFFPGTVLPTNIKSGVSIWTDFTRHDFQDVYLNPDYAAWPEVRKKLAAAIDSLQPAGKVKFTATWDPATSLEFRMMVNGMDTSYAEPDPDIVASAGRATYCVDLPMVGTPITYTPKLVNRNNVSLSYSFSGPLGGQYGTVSTQSGIVPGFVFGTPVLVQNGMFSTYPATNWFQ